MEKDKDSVKDIICKLIDINEIEDIELSTTAEYIGEEENWATYKPGGNLYIWLSLKKPEV